ncbi:hypothetical protein PENTCL1PPCAC_3328, partial [Pristionchus entomophagus]
RRVRSLILPPTTMDGVNDVSSKTTVSKVFVASCLTIIVSLTSFDTHGIGGLVPLIQPHFNIVDSEAALIRTLPSVANTVALAFIWIFGDVFHRRMLFLNSVFAWILLCLLSTLLGSQSFLIFVTFRSLAAAASSIYEVLVPVFMADLFQNRSLGVALMCKAASEVLSSHIANILNSWIVSNKVPWQSGLIAAPVIVVLPLFGLLCASGSFRGFDRPGHHRSLERSFTNAFSIISIKSFILLTAEISFRTFHTRAFLFWFPTLLLNSWTDFPDAFHGFSYTTISAFYSIAKVSGVMIGLPLFLWFSQSWYHGTGPFSGRLEFMRAYPIVVSTGTLLNSISYAVGIIMLVRSYVAFMVSMFFVGFFGAADISLSQQMMLMVVPSSSRPAAVALSRLITGIVVIPCAQFVGMISDAYRGHSKLPIDRLHAYQVALFCSVIFSFASSMCDMVLIVFFPADCLKAEEEEPIDRVRLVSESSLLIGGSNASLDLIGDILE